MATESPLLHDGAQTVAAANYGNLQSLAGVNGSGQFLAVMLTSAGRTSVTATVTGQQIYGILQNKPGTGQAADVGIYGVTKAMAGGTIAAGAPVMASSNGTIVAWTSTGNKAQIGYAIEASVINQVFTMYLGPTGNSVA
jgi:hypothetical protein